MCDLVVPLGYGLTLDNQLPDAEMKVLDETVVIANGMRAKVAWASSSYFFPGSKEHEDELKRWYLGNRLLEPPLVAEGITNSVTEAIEVKKAAEYAGLHPQLIVIVLDWPHARSAQLIWKKVFPDAHIGVRSVVGRWDRSHRASLQQSDFRWLCACIARHAALYTLGVDRVAKIQHPTE